ncbi:DUF438 domain-containing protein [Lachnospira multipara]|uniref:DUF438 domain-containing protein n=1 Tax=Lachnospira multipara TaxID=28051 RepID=UPI000487DCB3|nr:DUF438 domain-containing protein [Lachnospira multipara]
MGKKINLKKSVYELCNEYPELIDILLELGFTEVTKPGILNTMGKVMTIPKGAIMKKIDMVDVVLALKNNGFELEGKMPSFVQKRMDNKILERMAAEEKTVEKVDAETAKKMLASQLPKRKDANGNEIKELELDERTLKIKSYVERLSKGEDIESVRKDFVENFTDVDAAEIAKAEQSLIAGGTPVAEVQKLCDVHSALFHGATREEKIANAEKAVSESLKRQNGNSISYGSIGKVDVKEAMSESFGMGIGSKYKAAPIKRQDGADSIYMELRKIENHPLNTFALENEAISDALKELRRAMDTKENIMSALKKAREASIHYAEKGDLLYPILNVKYGFSGPSNVMWGVDDEIRDEMKSIYNSAIENPEFIDNELWNERLDAVVTRAEEMIYKEENILFPLCAKNFSEEDWCDIARDFADYKPCLIGNRPLWEKATPKGNVKNYSQEAGSVNLPSGRLTIEQLDAMLNTIPMELTFVDADNVNRYFNDGDDVKLFKRPLSALGREVFSCHPPKIEPMVRMILEDFKEGRRDCVDVWTSRDDEPVLIKYMAVRDKDKNYIGTLECVQPMGFAKKHFKRI